MSGDETSLEARTQAFLAEFFDRGQQLVRDLIEENEALRTRLQGLEGEQDAEKLVSRLRTQVAELQAEVERMRRLAGSVEQESGGYRARLEELEAAHYHLAARQVSAEQLRGSGTVEAVVRCTTEILLNLVGTGHFRIYGVDRAGATLFPLWVEGTRGEADAEFGELPLSGGSGPARAVEATTSWQAPGDLPRDLADPLSFPLVCGERSIGAVELVRFLPQKHELTDDDLALLELISTESGAALDAAWIRAHAPDKPFSRSEVEALLG